MITGILLVSCGVIVFGLGFLIGIAHYGSLTENEEKSPEIVYLCDGMACGNETCKSIVGCCHTYDIKHARNFKEIAPGKYMEEE